MPSFPKANRLLAKPAFDLVLNDGIKVVCKDFVIVASRIQEESRLHARLGLIVSKKVGHAVQRNRIKRCLRESFRRRSLEFRALCGRDVVVIARPSLNTKDGKVSSDISSSFERCLGKLGNSISVNRTSDQKIDK